MSILAGIIPAHPVIVKCISRRSHGERQLFGADRVSGIRPHLPAGMRSRQRINRHVQNVWNFRGTLFAFDPVSDRDLTDPKVLADQRRQLRYRSARSTSEDRTQRFGRRADRCRQLSTNFRPPSDRAYGQPALR
jgi:hypothetical protein